MNRVVVRLKPIVRFRELPFGLAHDPSMAASSCESPWPEQENALAYLRSGRLLTMPMGADLLDWFDRSQKANPRINGQILGGMTLMTDGEWFWPAGLIYFVERYNVRLPEEFLQHAAAAAWRVDRPLDSSVEYEHTYE